MGCMRYSWCGVEHACIAYETSQPYIKYIFSLLGHLDVQHIITIKHIIIG
jgi:hypothetical protein